MPEHHTDLTEDEIDYDQEEVQSAKEVVQFLTKTAKTLKIYLPNNPIHQKFINSLFEKLSTHIESFGPLRLRVKQFEILCSGQQIYENLNRLESIAFRLFIDGLRELSFYPGLEKKELITFLKIIGQEEDDEAEGEAGADDDIVTRLWEKHLTHIQYIVVDDLKGDMDAVETCREMRPEPPKPQQLQALHQQEVVSPAHLVPKGVDVPALHIFKLSEEEVSAIKRELRWEEEIDIVNELEGMLFDILRIETDVARFSEVLGIIDNILEELMFKADFIHARKILEFYWEMLDPEKSLSAELVDLLKKALIQGGNPERIASMDDVLNRVSSEALDQFLPLMVLFQKEVIPSVIELLAEVKAMKPRRVLCDILVELAQMDVNAIIACLHDRRWFVVRNLIYVLGKTGDACVIEHLPQFVHHEELKVRKEVLHVLDAMKNPKADVLLIDFIDDSELSNRVYAIKSLVKRKVLDTLPLLVALVSTKEFEMKALYEKKEIFSALAKLGGDSLVPEFEKHLKTRWSLFKNIHVDERGLCAAMALQRLGSPAAIIALQGGGQSRNKVIREACEKALGVLGAA